jgi:uncharacterized protein (TIGR02145 family)
MLLRARATVVAFSLALGAVGLSVEAANSQHSELRTPADYSPKQMADGKQWTTRNLNVSSDGSYCYDGAEANCERYGRLYTWDAAQRVCQSLGGGWRLPTNEEWQRMAKHYGGVRDDSTDGGKAAFPALIAGGSSGFNAVFGGGRSPDGREYARLEAHGFYWTASETDTAHAWMYNLGKNGQILNRHANGEKARAHSVRCIRG